MLLECGTGAATRRAAARQLGEVQRAHPHELPRLLSRLAVYLRAPAWETRVAAGQAVEAILSNVPEWDPPPCDLKEEPATQNPEDMGRLRLETFDIDRVMTYGSLLMSSEGKEYDLEEDLSAGGDIKEKLARQRQMLNARLGLDVASRLGMDLSDVYTNEDLVCKQGPTTVKTDVVRRPVTELMQMGIPSSQQMLSSREMNRARRKARQAAFAKQKSRDASVEEGIAGPSSVSGDEPERKKLKLEVYDESIVETSGLNADGTWSTECICWPLEAWCCWLGAELFASAWEARHGAATALRHVLKLHGHAVGKERGMGSEEMELAHQNWLEDMALRLVCVLALDRFGDFVSDQVVAPVRETCAQALGVTLSLLEPARVKGVAEVLEKLLHQPHWEARHGALLGFKYLIAVREELACETRAFDILIAGLADPVEDVGAVAAAALAPSAAALVARAPAQVPPAAARLWELLRDQDELAAACNSFMALLAAIVSLPQARALLKPISLTSVLPRLWPYLAHSTSSVRLAALQTLRTLTRPYPRSHTEPSNEDVPPPSVTNDKENKESTGNMESEEIIDNKETIESKEGIECKENIESEESIESKESIESEENIERKESMENIENTESKKSIGNKETAENQERKEVVKVTYSESVITAADKEKDLVRNGDTTSDYIQWTPELLQDALRHIFQRVLVEHIPEIQDISEQVWINLVKYSQLECLLHAACPVMSTWICLSMQPAKLAFDTGLLLQAPLLRDRKQRHPTQTESSAVDLSNNGSPAPPQKWYIGGCETTPLVVREKNVVRARCLASRMLGFLSCYIVKPAPGIIYTPEIESPIDCYIKVLLVYLSSKSAIQRLVTGLIISTWAAQDTSLHNGLRPQLLVARLHECLQQNIYYDEVAVTCNRILQDSRDLVAMMRHYKLPLEAEEWSNVVRLDQVIHLTGSFGQQLISSMKLKRISQPLEDRRKNINSVAIQCSTEQASLNISVQAALAGACANLQALPERLNPVVKPLMEAIKRETHEQLQQIAADNLAVVLSQCVDRQPSPNVKVLANLKTFLRCDPEFTPRVVQITPLDDASNGADSGSGESGAENSRSSVISLQDNLTGILTLTQHQRQAERATLRRNLSCTASGPGSSSPVCTGPPPLQRGPGRRPATDIPLDELFPVEDENQKSLRIQRRGATFAMTSLTKYFASSLPQKLPKLWQFITEPFTEVMTSTDLEAQTAAEADEVISCLQVLEVMAPHLHPALLPHIMSYLPAITSLLQHPYKAVRHMAARSLAVLADIQAPQVMQIVTDKIVPMLGAINCNRQRQGAAEALACIVDMLQISIVPYIVLLVVPLLGRMSDHDESVRLMSTRCFALLIQLMPLDGAVPEPLGLSESLRKQRSIDRVFLEHLFNPKSIKDYKIPIPISAELRSYQQAGVNWLVFLRMYGLHGVLCDDMGLGKTLQSICVVASDYYEKGNKYLRARTPNNVPMPSLVVCPPTLTGHWVYEVKKFLTRKYLNPLQYAGPPAERERLRHQVKHHNLVVASYDIVRKDIEFFSHIKWNYCILDEGHIIKNGRTKNFKAIKRIVAKHRLILSGTPIQNNVLELWSLFDFLMPGLLGTERQFTARYSRPILAARDARATAQHQEAGARAMEALHRQVLPFLLRRVKEDVLKELPPKITQDYYCELSTLQRRLYEDFSRTHMPDGLRDDGIQSQSHIFQALRYLQNVCNHPKLVLTPEHPEYLKVRTQLYAQDTSLNDIDHSAKLPALKQLLQDCGIGISPSNNSSAVLSQHRALVFCQLKTMLDIVEHDLLKTHLPDVSYLRLDGSVPPGLRHQLVQRFNNDPSIDVLLLTTRVGGLGLNLTGADTVIFVEHDWNPMKDLQAMDRAHRIGQKKVVNVYRLITRNTLEEKIMGLQKFKLLTANTVISGENAALETMGTEQLLDLFQLSNDIQGPSIVTGEAQQVSGQVTMKTVLESLPDLWDDKQYEEEYDMTKFIQGLKK